MTLAEYIRSLPAARVERAANDLGEAARIEAEHAALPRAIFDTPEAAEGGDPGGISGEVRPELSFDLSDDDSVRGFISGMEVSHPELVNRLRRDERAWDEMVTLDRGHMTRLQRDGGVKFSGDDNADYDFYRWAYGRGMLASDTSLGGLASAFGRGFLQIVKGAAKLTGTAAKSVVNPTAGVELAATAVDSAHAAVAEYQQLGAGLAALTSGDDPQVRMAAMYELAKFSDEEQRTHNAWRKAISDSFAEVPVDEDSVEFLSETFDVSNLIGAGAGKLVTRGLKRVGASGAAELLGRSRTAFGSEMLASTLSKVPLVGTPYKRAILVGQADLLSTEAQVAYEAVARAQADLAAKRATLAASPASDPKDVLLRKVAEAETDVARRLGEFNSAKSKLDSVRRNVAETLDLEGRGLLNLAAAGAVEGTGTLVRGTGRTMTRAYRGLSELLTGEADNAAFDMAAGQVAGGLANKGNIITRLGQDIVTAGRTMAQNGATIPYFRRLRQAEDATKLTRGAAAFIDWSHLGWAAEKLGDTGKAGAAGAPLSGAFGYVASGGDLAAAVESAGAGAAYGIGGGAYGQWEAYKDPRFRYEELLSNRREFRDTLSAREVGGVSQLQIFDQLDAGDQLAIASYSQGKPDVAFRFINDRNQASGYYDRDNNVVVINRASKTPLADIFRHEVAHFVERHGLHASVRELYLGDAEKGVIGQFTALDPLGNPVFVESTDPDGTTRYRYRLNDAGEKLKAEYTAKIRAVDPTFSMSDEYLASELFAEQYADYLFGGRFRRDLSRNAFDNVVEALAGKRVVKKFLGGIGLLFDSDDNVVGTGVFRELKGNEGVRRLISGFTADVAKGRKPAIEDSVEQHVFTETELRDPELATKWLQGGGAMRFGPDGRPVYDAKGVPQFLTEKEADAQQRDLANELIAAIEKHVAENPADADVLQRREIIDVNGVKRTLFSGRRIPAAVIESLEAQKRFNPHQLAHLRAASASVEKHGTGAMIAHFYQAASRKLGGKAYKTVGGRWRRDGVVGFQITKDGNVVINSVSWEQLAENARRAAGQKLAREIYATSGVPVDAAIMADVKTYLGNVIDGRPGATGIGETRRDFINHLFGIRMASNEDVNPFFASIAAPKTVLTNLRLDRINRLAPLDHVEVAWGPQNYRRVKANMRPENLPAKAPDSETVGLLAGSETDAGNSLELQYRPDAPESKQPARNENAFTRSLEHIKEAIPPAERFVGRFEPGKPILRPSGRDWHSGDAEAPVGDLGFSQSVIDEAFHAAVSESGPAAQKAVDALAEAGDRMIPPSERHWAEAGRNLKLVDRLWYEYSSEAMRKAFPGEDPKARLIQVADQIAATSPLADPNYNAELAISILSEMERGGPIFTPAVNMSGVSDAALGKFGAGESRKVGSFSETFKFLGGAHDEPPLTTNDRQVAASFGIPDAAFGKYPVLYEVVSRFYNHLRDDYNARHGLVEGRWHGDDNGPMQSHQLQAISWVQTRAETRMENRKEITEEEAFNGDAYHQAFKLAAERLREGGVNVPVDENGDPRFTREVLQDPRVTSILAPTTDDFRHSLMLTQEIGTNLTEVGREFGELVAKSKELGITKNLEEAEKITNRYLNALGQRTKVEGKAKKEPSVMGKLVSAFAGKAIDVSRIEKGWGSFEGEFSKNLRVPIDDVPEQYREAFISVIGRRLKQAAGAASKFVNTDTATPAEGTTRTYTVFLPGVLEPSADLTILAKHLSALGHEVNVSERPNGLVLDVNPAFGDSGPKGIDFNALEHLVERTFGDKAKISFADHSSYYVDGSQYAAKISQARKQLIDEAARNISQFFPSVRSAKDFLRSDAPTSGPQANDARRAEAVRARYAESIRLLESAEKDLAKVARDYERDMTEAVEVLRKRIARNEAATQVSEKASDPPR